MFTLNCPCPGFDGKHKDNNIKERRCISLANIKSAKKRILVNETKAARNKAIRSKVKTAIKKVDAAVASGDKAAAQAALLAATTEIDKAATKGVYHKNNASRKVSRLSKAVNSIA
jgi:small subunit ribosomal protein S20